MLSCDSRRILCAQGLRALLYGFGSVLLGVTLQRRGFSSTEVGVVLAAVVEPFSSRCCWPAMETDLVAGGVM